MILVLLIALLAGILYVWLKGRQWPFQLPLLAGLGLLSVALLVFRFVSASGTTEYTGDFEDAAGYMLAAKVKEAFPNGGTVVVIQQRGQLKHINDVAESQIRGIRRQLEDEVKWPIHQTGPMFSFGGQSIETPTGFTYDTCAEWMKDVPNAVAVISFLGLPDPDVKPKTADGKKKQPPYCALMPGTVETSRWGRDIKTLTVAAHKKNFNPKLVPKGGASAQEVFDMRFEWAKE